MFAHFDPHYRAALQHARRIPSTRLHPEDAAEEMVAEHYRALGRLFLTLVGMRPLRADVGKRSILRVALDRGPVVIALPHVSNLGDVLAVLDQVLPDGGQATVVWNADVVGRTLATVGHWLTGSRRIRFLAVPLRKKPAAEVVQLLSRERGHVTCLSGTRGDLAVPGETKVVRLWEHRARHPILPAVAAIELGATLLACNVGPTVDGSKSVYVPLGFSEPIRPLPDVPVDEEVRRLMQFLADRLAMGIETSWSNLDHNRPNDYWED